MKKQPWYEIRNKTGDVAEIYIYGIIGRYDDVTAIDFIKDLKEITAEVIAIYINSEGGGVFEGMAIYNAILRERTKGKVINTYIEGLAASTASFVALAGEVVYMARNATYMIHNTSGITMGDSKDHEKTVKILEFEDSQIADIYAQKTGKKIEEIHALMDGEKWMGADEAKDYGFIDEITNELKAAACVDPESALWKGFKNIPKNFTFENKTFPHFQTKAEEGKDMEKLLKLLNNAADEPAAITEVTELQNKAATLETENQKLKDEQRKIKVENAIKDGKMYPAQKDFALDLTDEQLDKFIATGKAVDLSKKDEINDGEEGAGVTYQQLLDDPKLYAKYRAENPELVEKLHNQYIENGGN